METCSASNEAQASPEIHLVLQGFYSCSSQNAFPGCAVETDDGSVDKLALGGSKARLVLRSLLLLGGSSVARHEQPPCKVPTQSNARCNYSTALAIPLHSRHTKLRKAQLRHVKKRVSLAPWMWTCKHSLPVPATRHEQPP